MRVRILAAVSAALLAMALAPAAAMAAADNPVPLKGTIWTTMAQAAPVPCVIVGKGEGTLVTVVDNGQLKGQFTSTLSQLGKITLRQPQCVVTTEEQFPGGPPKKGWIQVRNGTITAANGDTMTFSTAPVSFEAFAPPGLDPTAGPLPIGFSGEMEITGGTGRFAPAGGSAEFEGFYCFRVNGGTYTLIGALTR